MYKALIGFSGLQLTMRKDEVREIKDETLIQDLLKANYIEEVKATEEVEEKPKKNKK